MVEPKKCERCGGELPPDSTYRRRFCDECRKKNDQDQKRKYREEDARYGYRARRKTHETKQPGKSLSQMAKEAHQLQLTYGKYTELIAGGRLQRYCEEHGFELPGG